MMFGMFDLDKEISMISEYLSINDIIYNEELIKNEFDKFEREYSPLNAKCKLGMKEYSMYTDMYIKLKKDKLLSEIFKQYPGMESWSRRLKMMLLQLGKPFLNRANMIPGVYDDRLLPFEILYNEEKARLYLSSLRIKKSAEDMRKKK